MKGLFSLDVDNDIWQDIGLADDEFGRQVPPWLGDEDVRNGIQIVQEIMNCHDELYLCEHERSSLQHWFNDESAALIAVLQASKEDADLQFFLWEHAQWLIDLGKRWGRSIDALAPNVAQSEVGQSEVAQSKVAQSEVGQSKVAQSKVGQYEVGQSEVAQSDMPQSGISWADFPRQGGRTLTRSLAEQAAIPKLPRSDKWTVGPGEGEVDSSDDDEEFELEPRPVIADPVLLAATDLLHEGHSDDMGSETSSDEE
ncbi:hypothetical protein BS47DRAFT_1368265 [Hydnum rufescens UP504]|uniref:Uncharacterized protein n=1 Tax=Hydnum rufescens UP504 TaxID=1448309 RepID=A0A9P6AG95_9AGAM|nr:hypothetical protein BS47DRAFT_1368265 [Hydnum rufescens UP504]